MSEESSQPSHDSCLPRSYEQNMDGEDEASHSALTSFTSVIATRTVVLFDLRSTSIMRPCSLVA